MIEENFLGRDPPPSPEDIVLAQTLDGELQEALDQLSEEYRLVVLMALLEEMSYKEIAAALSIPLGTVVLLQICPEWRCVAPHFGHILGTISYETP